MILLKNKDYETNSLAQLLKIVPEGSVIDSYMFFSGQLELMLSKYNRFVCAHTTQYVVYEFWSCLLENSNKIYDIASTEFFKFDDKEFPFLQENFAKYKDQYVRSAIFYFLNKCSSSGAISYGAMEKEQLSKVDLATLKTFKKPENFFLVFDGCNLVESLNFSKGDYQIVNAGRYSLNLFEEGKSYGLEETKLEHSELFEYFCTTNRKIALVYKNNPIVISKYSDICKNIYFINQYGNITDSESAKEVIVANF
tara:strand:- start:370 stop:1128 length:759 start_codon:yes stop_codon:yes gene_type:complete